MNKQKIYNSVIKLNKLHKITRFKKQKNKNNHRTVKRN